MGNGIINLGGGSQARAEMRITVATSMENGNETTMAYLESMSDLLKSEGFSSEVSLGLTDVLNGVRGELGGLVFHCRHPSDERFQTMSLSTVMTKNPGMPVIVESDFHRASDFHNYCGDREGYHILGNNRGVGDIVRILDASRGR